MDDRPDNELLEKLQNMKKLLQKKEEKLKKYNRSLQRKNSTLNSTTDLSSNLKTSLPHVKFRKDETRSLCSVVQRDDEKSQKNINEIVTQPKSSRSTEMSNATDNAFETLSSSESICCKNSRTSTSSKNKISSLSRKNRKRRVTSSLAVLSGENIIPSQKKLTVQNLESHHTSQNILVNRLEDNPQDIIGTCFSISLEDQLTVLLVYPNNFSIWKLNDAKETPVRSDKMNGKWKRHFNSSERLISNKNRSLIIGGTSLKPYSEFMVVHSPSQCDSAFIVTYLCLSADGQLKTVSQDTEIRGCAGCSFRSSFGHSWDFWLYIDRCSNVDCPNTNDSRYWSIAYDFIFSHKEADWKLICHYQKKNSINRDVLVNLKVVHCCDEKYESENDLLVWQDVSGAFGLANSKTSIVFSDWQKEIGGRFTVICAVAVKEILILVLNTYCKLWFVATNPVSPSCFDIFYLLDFRDYSTHEEAVMQDAIFLNNKFYLIDSKSQIISFSL